MFSASNNVIVGRFGAVSLRTVSYTHLDVYKRQPLTSFSGLKTAGLSWSVVG